MCLIFYFILMRLLVITEFSFILPTSVSQNKRYQAFPSICAATSTNLKQRFFSQFSTFYRLSSAKSPHKVPNITLDPADQQKRAEDFALMKHRLKEETLKRRQAPHNHAGPHLWNQQKNRIPVKTEGLLIQ